MGPDVPERVMMLATKIQMVLTAVRYDGERKKPGNRAMSATAACRSEQVVPERWGVENQETKSQVSFSYCLIE